MNTRVVEFSRRRFIGNQFNSYGGDSVEQESIWGVVDGSGASIQAGMKRKAEHGAVTAKSSIRLLFDVISKFGRLKRDLVRSTGFGGILCFPPLRQINRRFAVWLMSRVEPLSQTIIINDSRKISYSKVDVYRIFGVPCEGVSVYQNGIASKEVVSSILCSYFGGDGKEHRSVKVAQSIIERDYGQEMSEDEEDAFKVAFVIYVMSTLLAPGGKYDCPDVDYWNALVDPQGIGRYDWADYVVRRLTDGVLKVKADLNGNIKAPTIMGCSIFLQVLYLDSINLGCLNLDHNMYPRIMFFCGELMKSMILADTAGDDVLDSFYGKNELRDPLEVCYSWAANVRGEIFPDYSWDDENMADAAAILVRGSSAPTEAMGPMYFAMVDNRRHSSRIFSTSGMRVMAVFMHIVNIFSLGFRYSKGANSSFDTSTRSSIETSEQNPCPSLKQFDIISHSNEELSSMTSSTQSQSSSCCSVSTGFKVVHHSVERFPRLADDNWSSLLSEGCSSKFAYESPVWIYKSFITARAMSKYFISVRGTKIIRGFDRSHISPTFNEVDMIPRKFIKSAGVNRSPFELCQDLGFSGIEDGLVRQFVSVLSNEFDLSRPWIISSSPKHIEVYGESIRMHCAGAIEMEMDLFDVIIRRFKEIDDRIYHDCSNSRWRHFYESDFMASVLSGGFDVNDLSIISQTIGSHITYDVPNCSTIFFPGILEHRWVCYVWEHDQITMTVFDPWLTSSLKEELEEIHCQVACAIKRALKEVFHNMFIGTEDDWVFESLSIIGMDCSNTESVNKTGSLCAQFCQSYHGRDGDIAHFMDMNKATLVKFLIEALRVKGNSGFIPDDIQDCILNKQNCDVVDNS